jgi:hypothetical protein
MVTKSDLTSEEWDALKRLSQGSALMMGARILDRLEELGLVEMSLPPSLDHGAGLLPGLSAQTGP